jgi:cysteine desulfurase family protein (TIGR01976 family)
MAGALAKTWQPGDEVVLSRLDHDADVRPWVQAAARAGAVVRWADVDAATAELPAEQYDHLLTERTRLVAVTAASNAIGTRPDVRGIADRAHAVGAVVHVDGVHATPHLATDVRELGADLYATSAYKWYGPHVGCTVGDPALLETLHPDKLLPSSDAVPDRFEHGTPSFAAHAGVAAAVDWIAGHGQGATRRERVLSAMAAIADHEAQVFTRLLDGLSSLDRVQLVGAPARRTPTVAFTVDGRSPQEVGAALGERGIAVWAGNYYAVELMTALGARGPRGCRPGGRGLLHDRRGGGPPAHRPAGGALMDAVVSRQCWRATEPVHAPGLLRSGAQGGARGPRPRPDRQPGRGLLRAPRRRLRRRRPRGGGGQLLQLRPTGRAARLRTRGDRRRRPGRRGALAGRRAGAAPHVRPLLDAPELAEAVALARRATEGCTPDGRPLYAAHADLEWPESLPLQLFHAITLLREHRGDGHVAVLVAEGVSGLESPSSTSRRATPGRASRCASAAAGRPSSGTPPSGACGAGLARRVRALHRAGRRRAAHVEARTDALALPPWERLGEDDCRRLRALVRPLSTAVGRPAASASSSRRHAGLSTVRRSRTRTSASTSRSGAGRPRSGGADQHDLADVGAGLQHPVRLRGLLERQHPVDDGPHLARLDRRPDVLPHRRDDRRLLVSRPGPQRGREDRPALDEQRAEVELAPAAALQADDHEAAADGQDVDVAGQVARPHVVEHDVGAGTARHLADDGDEVLVAVQDRPLRTELDRPRGLLGRPDRAEHPRSGRRGELDRHRPDAGGAAVHQEHLAGLQSLRARRRSTTPVQATSGSAAACSRVSPAGTGQQLAGRVRRPRRVAAARQQRADLRPRPTSPVTPPPARRRRPEHARPGTATRRAAGRRTPALHDVGAVDGRRGDVEQDLAGTGTGSSTSAGTRTSASPGEVIVMARTRAACHRRRDAVWQPAGVDSFYVPLGDDRWRRRP